MRAISVKQPWAFLIVEGYKLVENRTRHCRIRERVAIHASKAFDEDGYDFVRENFPHIVMPAPEYFTTGAIVGSVEIVDSVESMDDPFFFGPIGWKLKNPLPLGQPIHWRGSQGWFQVPSLDGMRARIPDCEVRRLVKKGEAS